MTPSLTCNISAPSFNYAITFKREFLKDCTFLAQSISQLGAKVAIISNSLVGPLYANTLCHALNNLGIESHLFLIKDGEEFKSRASKALLEDQMFEKKLGRDTCLIAMGGGVVTDLSGFIAATYCRGIPLILIPTSLLGMVDASIGGKTAINLPYGKNLLGAIYQPKEVIVDASLLATLCLNELKNGMAEMIKHALILDAAFFDYLSANVSLLLNFDVETIEQAIYTSCQIKKRIVELDEKETGIRRLLNFGHTVGHALEKISHYRLAHGQAVAIGLLTESYLACLKGYLKPHSFHSIMQLIYKFNFSFKLPLQISVEALGDAMQLDKKSQNNQPRFVMIDQIGSSLDFAGEYCASVPIQLLNKALKWMCHDLCCNSRPDE